MGLLDISLHFSLLLLQPRSAPGQPSLLLSIRNLEAYSVELLLAIWIAAVFTERLIVDLATVKYGEQWKTAKAHSLWHHAIQDSWVYLYVTIGLPLLFAAFVMTHQQADLVTSCLVGVQQHFFNSFHDMVLDSIVVSLAGFEYVLFKSARGNDSIKKAAKEVWEHDLRNNFKEIITVVLIVVGAFVGRYVFHVLAVSISDDPTYRRTIEAWAASNLIVALNVACYFAIYNWSIRGCLKDGHKGSFWRGFFKDVAIYSLAATCIANGLNRFRYALPSMTGRDRWFVWALFAFPTALVAILGAGLDLYYVRRWLAEEYPNRGPQGAMRFHIHFRILVLFAIPLALWFTYLADQIAAAAHLH